MVLLDTITLTKGTDRGTKQLSFVVPIDDGATNIATHLKVLDGATPLAPLAYQASYVTRSMYGDGGGDVRLVDLTVDETGSASSTLTLEVHNADQSPPAATLTYNAAIEQSLIFPGANRLAVYYKQPPKGPQASYLYNRKENTYFEVVDLATPSQRYYHRKGDLRTTTVDRHLLQSGLELVISLDYRAGEDQVDVDVLIQNGGIEEALSPTVEFERIKWFLPPGVEYQPVEWDPIGESGSRGHLVKASTGAEGTHVVRQRATRLVSGYLVLTGATPIKTFAGQGECKEAFAAHECGVGGTPIPTFTDIPGLRTSLDTDYANEKAAALAGNPPANYLIGGQDPPSTFWLTANAQYGGKTGGEDVDPVTGVLQMNTAEADHWERLRLIMTRYRCRQPSAIFYNGWPIQARDWLDSNNYAEWDVVDSNFGLNSATPKTPQDEPFNFYDADPNPVYHSEAPDAWDNIDQQHLVRVFKEALALAWYTNHPIAWMFVQMDAQLSMMHFAPWSGGSYKERWKLPNDPPANGINLGRAGAWSAYIISHARAMHCPDPDPYYDTWLDRMVTILKHEQMPNKLFSSQNMGKEATAIPFGDGKKAYWWVYRATQQPKWGIALWASRTLRPTGSNQLSDVNTLVDDLAEGIYDYLWQQDVYYPAGGVRTGIITKYVCGPNVPAGSLYRFSSYTQVPDPDPYYGQTILLHDSDANMISTFIGIAEKVGAAEGLNMARKMTGNFPAGTGPACRAVMEGWNPAGVPSPTGKPATTWGGSLGYYQKLHP